MQARATVPGAAALGQGPARARRRSLDRDCAAVEAGLRARAARRAANDEALRAGVRAGARLAFRCECTDTGCDEVVRLTAEEYGRIRARRGRFVVGRGHALHDVDLVVRSTDRYAVVRRTPSELFLG